MSDLASFRFDIPAGAVCRLESIVEATNRRAAVHGLSAYRVELSEPFEKPWDDPFTGRAVGTVTTVTATLTGAVPRHRGWAIVARLDHDEDEAAGGSGETVMSLFPGLPEDLAAVARAHRARPQQCDGCHATRHRTATYLAYHRETGRVLQLGSTCVEPYTGLPLKGLETLWRFGTLKEGDWEEAGEGGFPADLRVGVLDVLRVTVAVVTLTGGYRSREMSCGGETTTADLVSDYYYNRRANTLRNDVDADTSAAETAKAVRAWALAGHGADSDYRHKVAVLSKGETIHNRHLAVLASAVAGWSRDQRRAAEEAAARNSRHQGEVGQRITVTATVARVHELESRTYGYREQQRWLVTFQDPDDNVYIWYATTSNIPDERETVRLTGTVKKHDTFRDIAQTVLNRCRVTTAEPANA
ncbi:MAG: hypothetical protein JO362_22035 [Streptomycetaceae bacterium]|nr:hypothetical protein [Streptomycetaceae bacterium]